MQIFVKTQPSKLKQPDFTLSFRHAAPTLVVHDETAIPPDFFKPQPVKLDRQGLLPERQQPDAPWP